MTNDMKIVHEEIPVYGYDCVPKPDVTIKNVISFQKFRHYGENRPGIKNQNKKFMTLQLNNLQGKLIRVIIVCVDADTNDILQVHPNGLAGKDCHNGIYDSLYTISSSEDICNIEIPYIHIERMKTRKSNIEKNNQLLMDRVSFLPSPWREKFMSQCQRSLWSNKIDTTKSRLAVIITVQCIPGWLDKPLVAVSDIIKNGSQNTSLGILRISSPTIPANTGAYIDIFTTESSPSIEPGKYKVYITYQPQGENQKLEYWISDEFWPGKSCIVYKKVVSYLVPPFTPDLAPVTPVQATLHLVCSESNLHSTIQFLYVSPPDMLNVPVHNKWGVMCHADLDARTGTKRSRPELFDDNDDDNEIAAILKESIKLKQHKYQDDVTNHVTKGSETQSKCQSRPHITDVHYEDKSQRKPHITDVHYEDKSQRKPHITDVHYEDNPLISLATVRDNSQLLNMKTKDMTNEGGVDNTNWFASFIDQNSNIASLEHQLPKTESNIAQKGISRGDNRSVIQYALADHQETASLQRRAIQFDNLQQVISKCQDTVVSNMLPDCTHDSQSSHIQQSSSTEDVTGDCQMWCGQTCCDRTRKNNTIGYEGNRLSCDKVQTYSNKYCQHSANFQANIAKHQDDILLTGHTSVLKEETVSNLSATNLDSMDLAEFLAENLPTVDISKIQDIFFTE